MTTTYSLWERALSSEPNKAEWARRLDVHRTAFTRVENERHLSVTLAGKLAQQLGENPRDWIALAALEEAEARAPKAAQELKRACRYI